MKAEITTNAGAETSIGVGLEQGTEMKTEVKEEHAVDKVPTASDAAERKAGLEIKVLNSAVKKYCFIWGIPYNDLEDEYELATGPASIEKVSLVLANAPYITFSARGHLSSAHDVFLKRDMKGAVRPMTNVMPPGARGHTICLDVLLCRWNRSRHAGWKEVCDVKGKLKGKKANGSEMFEVLDQAFLYIKKPAVYIRIPRRRVLFHASVSRMGTHFCRKEAT